MEQMTLEQLEALMRNSMDRALNEHGTKGVWSERVHDILPNYDTIYGQLKQMFQEGKEEEIKGLLEALDDHEIGEPIGTSLLEDLSDKDGIDLFHLFEPEE